jgi:hypothetical protein
MAPGATSSYSSGAAPRPAFETVSLGAFEYAAKLLGTAESAFALPLQTLEAALRRLPLRASPQKRRILKDSLWVCKIPRPSH